MDEKINPQLFGALMSALNTFAEKLSDGGITNFELSNLKFIVVKRRDFLFIGSTSNKIKEKKAVEEIKKIGDLFFKNYPQEVLVRWDNDVSIFSDFGIAIEGSLEKNSTDKMKEAFW